MIGHRCDRSVWRGNYRKDEHILREIRFTTLSRRQKSAQSEYDRLCLNDISVIVDVLSSLMHLGHICAYFGVDYSSKPDTSLNGEREDVVGQTQIGDVLMSNQQPTQKFPKFEVEAEARLYLRQPETSHAKCR